MSHPAASPLGRLRSHLRDAVQTVVFFAAVLAVALTATMAVLTAASPLVATAQVAKPASLPDDGDTGAP